MNPTDDLKSGFSRLFEAHRGIVIKVAATYAREAADRADLAQDIATQLWRAFPGFDASRPFATWMYRIALNVAISYARSRSVAERHRVAFDAPFHSEVEDPHRGADADADACLRALEAAIAALDPLNRALVLLHLEGHGHADIADILGISESNSSTRLSRIRQQLQNAIG